MFNKELIELINNSWILKKLYIKVILSIIFIFLVLYITILILWTFIPNINIDYIKVKSISTILATIFWGSFIMLIIQIATKWEENNKNKEKILKILKKITENNKNLYKKYINFSTTRSKWDWKLLLKEKKYEFSIWLWDDDDFWKFYIYTKNYNDLPKEIKKNFVETKWWEKNSYPYKESFSNYENLEKQFIEIDKILWNSK